MVQHKLDEFNEVRKNMKLLNKTTKWFFNTTKIEVNTDWRLVALDLNQQLIKSEMEKQALYQRIADLEKILEV